MKLSFKWIGQTREFIDKPCSENIHQLNRMYDSFSLSQGREECAAPAESRRSQKAHWSPGLW